MNLLSKVILTIISFSIFLALIFATYIANNFSRYEKPYFESQKSGIQALEKQSNNYFSVSELKQNSKIKFEKVGISDKIIFSSGSTSIETQSGILNINITPGIYMFDFREILNEYKIIGDGFEFSNKGPGIFVVNNIDPKKNLIFSINGVIELYLKNIKTKEDITSLELFPHTYLLFNPEKNSFVKNSDLLKISQTFSLGYFNDKLIIDNEINQDFLNLLSIKIEENKEIINDSILFISQELKNKDLIIQKFVNSSMGTIPGEQLIYKYFGLLKNPNKKSLYYKNIIIRNLHELITDENNNTKNINNIKENLSLLSQIEQQSYQEIIEILSYYYGGVISSNKSINMINNFSNLITSINKNNQKSISSLVYLNKTFFEYDFSDKTSFYNDIVEFKQKYLKDLKIDIETENKDLSDIKNIKNVDYMLFFFENILLSDFGASYTDKDTQNLITIFSDYVNIANSFYSFSDEKVKRTGIFTYSKILNKFVDVIAKKYFYENRDDSMLLVLKNDSELEIDDLSKLESNINQIFDFYNNNKLILEPGKNNKDKFVINIYLTLSEKYKEFFSALENYAEYMVKYDKSKKELLETNSVNEFDNTISLSLANAKNYLKNFNGTYIDYSEISIMDYNYCKNPSEENIQSKVEVPYCYKIDNLIVNGHYLSFLLFPFEKNNIVEIYLDHIGINASYKLDDIKENMDKKMETETQEKEKYNFANFLLYTFGMSNIKDDSQTNTTIIKDQNTILEEDSVVKIFKRNKLLGKTGDFAGISGYFNVEYNDLIVNKINDIYYINIKYSTFNINIGENTNQIIKGELYGEYNFSTKHSFINPKIKLIDPISNKYQLLGNYIYFKGEIPVKSFNQYLGNIFSNYSQINTLVNEIYNSLQNPNITIDYDLNSGKITFSTSYNNKTININQQNNYITSVKYDNVEILDKQIIYSDLGSFLGNNF